MFQLHLVEKFGGWKNRKVIDFYENYVKLFLQDIKIKLNIGLHLMK